MTSARTKITHFNAERKLNPAQKKPKVRRVVAQSEASIERQVVREAKALGVNIIKFSPKGQNGWPDRIALVPGGRPIFIEFKRPGKTPDALQQHRLQQLADLGYDAFWCVDAELAILRIAAKMGSTFRPKKSSQVPP